MRATIEDRFWSKVDMSGDCWLWTAGKNSSGYGRFHVDQDRHSAPAHRVAYELLVGPIPEGLDLDHLCRNRACVNPAHLEPVTHRENVLRGISPSAHHAQKTHCEKGHELAEENLYKRPNAPPSRRECRICLLDRVRRSKRRRRARRIDAQPQPTPSPGDE